MLCSATSSYDDKHPRTRRAEFALELMEYLVSNHPGVDDLSSPDMLAAARHVKQHFADGTKPEGEVHKGFVALLVDASVLLRVLPFSWWQCDGFFRHQCTAFGYCALCLGDPKKAIANAIRRIVLRSSPESPDTSRWTKRCRSLDFFVVGLLTMGALFFVLETAVKAYQRAGGSTWHELRGIRSRMSIVFLRPIDGVADNAVRITMQALVLELLRAITTY